jgi:hypothetical protein
MYGNPHKITRGDIITAAKKKAKGAAKGAAKGMGGRAFKAAAKGMTRMLKGKGRKKK